MCQWDVVRRPRNAPFFAFTVGWAVITVSGWIAFCRPSKTRQIIIIIVAGALTNPFLFRHTLDFDAITVRTQRNMNYFVVALDSTERRRKILEKISHNEKCNALTMLDARDATLCLPFWMQKTGIHSECTRTKINNKIISFVIEGAADDCAPRATARATRESERMANKDIVVAAKMVEICA